MFSASTSRTFRISGKHPRFSFVRGDGGEEEDFKRLSAALPHFDIIIDDASHASLHQQLALKTLFPRLREGGTYVIEDLQWQPPVYEDKTITVPKTADFLINYFVERRYYPNAVLDEAFMKAMERRIRSYAWFPSFTGIASAPNYSCCVCDGSSAACGVSIVAHDKSSQICGPRPETLRMGLSSKPKYPENWILKGQL